MAVAASRAAAHRTRCAADGPGAERRRLPGMGNRPGGAGGHHAAGQSRLAYRRLLRAVCPRTGW